MQCRSFIYLLKPCSIFSASVLCTTDEGEEASIPDALVHLSMAREEHWDAKVSIMALMQEQDCETLVNLSGVDPIVRSALHFHCLN